MFQVDDSDDDEGEEISEVDLLQVSDYKNELLHYISIKIYYFIEN